MVNNVRLSKVNLLNSAIASGFPLRNIPKTAVTSFPWKAPPSTKGYLENFKKKKKSRGEALEHLAR